MGGGDPLFKLSLGEAGVENRRSPFILRGEPVRVKFVWDEITADSARWTQSFRRPHDPDWEVNWVMTFSR